MGKHYIRNHGFRVIFVYVFVCLIILCIFLGLEYVNILNDDLLPTVRAMVLPLLPTVRAMVLPLLPTIRAMVLPEPEPILLVQDNSPVHKCVFILKSLHFIQNTK